MVIKLKQTAVLLSEEDMIFLKSKGINKSRLLRQAIDLVKTGNLEYSYIDKDNICPGRKKKEKRKKNEKLYLSI